jgi:acetyl esterase
VTGGPAAFTVPDPRDPARRVPVLLHLPDGPPDAGWLVWAHGGSWRSGSAAAWAPAVAGLARAAGAAVLSVDYRLAPAHRHPAALTDVLAAYDWLRARLPPGRPPAVGGDSAGATLAACAALVLRDRGTPPAAQLLAYPPLDPHCRAASYRRRPGAFPAPGALRAAWAGLRGPGYRPGTLPSTPLEVADLAGTPPAVLVTGTRDPVADDVRGHAARLAAAGVPVRLVEVGGAAHGAFLTDPAFRHALAAAHRAAAGPHDPARTGNPAPGTEAAPPQKRRVP